jgi:hypothetical protein
MLSASLLFTPIISDVHGINIYKPIRLQMTAKIGHVQPIRVAGLNLFLFLPVFHWTETMK